MTHSNYMFTALQDLWWCVNPCNDLQSNYFENI